MSEMSLKRSSVLGLCGALEILRATLVTSEANFAVSFRADMLMRRTLCDGINDKVIAGKKTSCVDQVGSGAAATFL